jgi:glutamate/tyrosine decarboxylase-like PLP-dependent enzyme
MKNHSLHDAWTLSSEYFEGSLTRSVGKLKTNLDQQKPIDLSLQSGPRTRDQLLDDMKFYLDETTNTLSPQFQNQLFSGLNPYALAGDWLASLTNTTMATYEVAPMATVMERELVQHMNKKVGWESGGGIMVTGGSNANLVALLMARNTLFPESKEEGNKQLKLVLFVSEEAHYSFDKAANLMGLGSHNVRKVPSDLSGRMKSSVLEEMIHDSKQMGETPFFVAATAGTTVLGVYDPILEVSEVCKTNGLWFHVDGAWGASVLLSQKHRFLMKGIDQADSLAWDTHKMMGTGLISSFFLCKNKHALRRSHDGGGNNYIFHDSELSSLDSGPSSLQCGRRNDALKVWLAWRSLGDQGFEKLIDTLFEKALMATSMILETQSLELLYKPEMLNICFRYETKGDSNAVQKEIRRLLLEDGKFFVNISTRCGQTFFRMITANPALEKEHVQELLESIVKLGNKITKDLK